MLILNIWLLHHNNIRRRFKLAVRNSQFAKHFGSLQMNFCIFSKNCESLKSDTSWIFRVIHWTSYIRSYFKPNKYSLLNNNVISQRFIILASSYTRALFLSFCYDLANCKPLTVSETSESWIKHCFVNLTMFTLKQLANHFLNFCMWHSTTFNVCLRLIFRLDFCASRSPYS